MSTTMAVGQLHRQSWQGTGETLYCFVISQGVQRREQSQ